MRGPAIRRSNYLPPVGKNAAVRTTHFGIVSRLAGSLACGKKWSNTLLLCLALAGWVLGLPGCTPKNSEHLDNSSSSVEPPVSAVPLRVQVVGEVPEADVIVRQWLSDSEQPIELASISSEALLTTPSLPADVLLFPARLLGDLVQREAIVKLPLSPFRDELADETSLEQVLSVPPAMLRSATYDETLYAVPLGCSIVRAIGSNALSQQLSENKTYSWPELIAKLASDPQTSSSQSEFSLPDPALVNRDALVDRFLTLAFAVTEQNTKYGVLFDEREMHARLASTEFVAAVAMLRTLMQQPNGGLQSVVASHSAAWRWAAENEQPVLALVSATELSKDALSVETGQLIATSANALCNTGGGMLAAMSVNCRQSAQAGKFIQWLTDEQSRQALRSLVVGVEPISAQGVVLADRVLQANREFLNDPQIPNELRLPRALQYRTALAEGLIRIFANEVAPEQGLREIASQWDSITDSASGDQKSEYRKSLGLSL